MQLHRIVMNIHSRVIPVCFGPPRINTAVGFSDQQFFIQTRFFRYTFDKQVLFFLIADFAEKRHRRLDHISFIFKGPAAPDDIFNIIIAERLGKSNQIFHLILAEFPDIIIRIISVGQD
ncbi:MAG: hypothetical protein BWX55_01856 [Deltaproteobacteria bacterium ADurb.Bin022]|nr:MAG: hypothetical protein BWX55_01856 [Deltaproteobacteria bacterium ADurb.Bin022]